MIGGYEAALVVAVWKLHDSLPCDRRPIDTVSSV